MSRLLELFDDRIFVSLLYTSIGSLMLTGILTAGINQVQFIPKQSGTGLWLLFQTTICGMIIGFIHFVYKRGMPQKSSNQQQPQQQPGMQVPIQQFAGAPVIPQMMPPFSDQPNGQINQMSMLPPIQPVYIQPQMNVGFQQLQQPAIDLSQVKQNDIAESQPQQVEEHQIQECVDVEQ